MPTLDNAIKKFGGIKNDENIKQIPANFFWKIKNWDYPKTGVLGLDTILAPERKLQFDDADIDGEFEFRYLDGSNVLQTEYIVVNNGKIQKWDLSSTKSTLKSGLTAGKVSFAVFNDKLFIANGLDNVQVYNGTKGTIAEMGAPFAEDSGNVGDLIGAYYYAQSYITSGGEEVIGSVSNTLTVTNKQVLLTLPLGYEGTTSRKIYRTTASGSTLYLVATIDDNTTLTYTDNTADSSLGAQILPTNNALPKPYFLVVSGQKMFGIKTSLYPTQVFITGVNNEIFDLATGSDLSNYGGDNTPVAGGGVDFNKVIVGSGKNLFLIDPIDNSVVTSRAYVGIKDGYSCQSLPAFGDFLGGLIFLSTKNDVRIMRGEQGSIPTTLSNLGTDNWAQDIRGDLETALTSYSNICSEFFEYKYLLVVDSQKFVFDIRTKGWTEHEIKTASYTSTPTILAVLNNGLYNGQSNGWIEKEYTSVQYRSEDVEKYIESAYIGVGRDYKFAQGIAFWFTPTSANSMNLTVITDDNQYLSSNQTFTVLSHSTFSVTGGQFNGDYFSANYYDNDLSGMDYKVVNIQKNCRWFKWILDVTKGSLGLQGIEYIGLSVKGKE